MEERMPQTAFAMSFETNAYETVHRFSVARKEVPDFWGIVLAGGDGNRLSLLTRKISGEDCPKQFCPILGPVSMLTQTRNRISRKISREATLFVLNKKHRKFYLPLLRDIPAERLIEQPENKGTALAILYAIMKVSRLTSSATVAIFPSDHFFTDEVKFMESVERAKIEAENNPDKIILMGVEPTSPETEYGWIEHSNEDDAGLAKVEGFCEKPTPNRALELFQSTSLWNSFVLIGKVAAFRKLFMSAVPDLYREFAAIAHLVNTVIERGFIHDLYRRTEALDFSSEILQTNTDSLRVMKTREVGWSDIGDSRRVFEILNTLEYSPNWAKNAA